MKNYFHRWNNLINEGRSHCSESNIYKIIMQDRTLKYYLMHWTNEYRPAIKHGTVDSRDSNLAGPNSIRGNAEACACTRSTCWNKSFTGLAEHFQPRRLFMRQGNVCRTFVEAIIIRWRNWTSNRADSFACDSVSSPGPHTHISIKSNTRVEYLYFNLFLIFISVVGVLHCFVINTSTGHYWGQWFWYENLKRRYLRDFDY